MQRLSFFLFILFFPVLVFADEKSSLPAIAILLLSDTTPPVITLHGQAILTINVGETFVDEGAEARDETDGMLLVVTSGEVDSFTPGTYTISYTATDSSGNSTTAERTVHVVVSGKVEVYSHPGDSSGIYASAKYQVTLVQNGLEYPSHVYRSINNHTKKISADQPEVLLTDAEREAKFKTDSNHWTSFSFEGSVTVEITVPDDSTPAEVRVLPTHRAINVTSSGSTISFDLDSPGNFYVQIEGQEREPLFVFANELPPLPPDVSSKNVFTGDEILENPSLLDADTQQTIYFGPGVHIISEPVLDEDGMILAGASDEARFPLLPSNTTVYIDGGAYLKGLFRVDDYVENVHFTGRGVVSGVDYPHQSAAWGNHLLEFEGYGNHSSNFSVEGLTLVDMPKTCITARSGPIVIDSVKCLSWHSNTDGIASGPGSTITNSFFKVFDDVIKLFHSNITVESNVIWHQQTGSAFQLSWNLSQDVSNVSVSNIDIVAVDRYQGTVYQTGGSASDYPDGSRDNGAINNALINLRNLKGALISNVSFDAIRFEAQPFQLMQLQLKDFRTGFTSGFGDVDGVSLGNVAMPALPRVESYLLDNGVGDIVNISFDNLYVNDQLTTHTVIEETANPE